MKTKARLSNVHSSTANVLLVLVLVNKRRAKLRSLMVYSSGNTYLKVQSEEMKEKSQFNHLKSL